MVIGRPLSAIVSLVFLAACSGAPQGPFAAEDPAISPGGAGDTGVAQPKPGDAGASSLDAAADGEARGRDAAPDASASAADASSPADAGRDAEASSPGADAAAADAAQGADAGVLQDAGGAACVSGATRCAGYAAEICGFSGWAKISYSQPGSQACCSTTGRFTTTPHTVIDSRSGLEWMREPGGAVSHTAALQLCDSYGGVYDAGSGWRMPTAAELQALVIGAVTPADGYTCVPSIDQNAFPNTAPSMLYGTIDPAVGVSFGGTGAAYATTPSAARNVRCVR